MDLSGARLHPDAVAAPRLLAIRDSLRVVQVGDGVYRGALGSTVQGLLLAAGAIYERSLLTSLLTDHFATSLCAAARCAPLHVVTWTLKRKSFVVKLLREQAAAVRIEQLGAEKQRLDFERRINESMLRRHQMAVADRGDESAYDEKSHPP